MDPISLGLLGGGALLGLAGQQQGQAAARRSQQEAQDILNAVPLPILQKYYPELYKQVVALSPEMEAAQTLGPSAMESVAVDPALRQAQINALLKLQSIGDQGGMTATDQARLAQIQSEQAAALRGQTGAIQQNLATRGLSGGMSELVARNIAAQESANRAAQQGLDVKAQAEQRALQAIMNAGQLGGQIGAQEFGQQSQIAQAKDIINKFNVSNLQDIQRRNIEARNAAAAANAQAQQQIASQNVGLRNQAQQYNLSIPQQEYLNRMQRATGQSQAAQQAGNLASQQQAQTGQFLGGLLQTGAQLYAGSQK